MHKNLNSPRIDLGKEAWNIIMSNIRALLM